MNIAKLATVSDRVKPRRYDSSRRREAAQATRRAILQAARDLFATNGYVGTTIAQIAHRAGVAPDTVYAAVGTKPVLFELLIETALSGRDEAVPGAARDYAARMRATPDARTKLAIYAAAVTQLQGRLAPLFLALRAAASSTPELDQLWRRITERRAVNMRAVADDLGQSGDLRGDLSRDEVADIIWTMNGAEYYALLVLERGWTPERFEQWLLDAWTRLLLC
jgi:AcrR family transcriptional regulator